MVDIESLRPGPGWLTAPELVSRISSSLRVDPSELDVSDKLRLAARLQQLRPLLRQTPLYRSTLMEFYHERLVGPLGKILRDDTSPAKTEELLKSA